MRTNTLATLIGTFAFVAALAPGAVAQVQNAPPPKISAAEKKRLDAQRKMAEDQIRKVSGLHRENNIALDRAEKQRQFEADRKYRQSAEYRQSLGHSPSLEEAKAARIEHEIHSTHPPTTVNSFHANADWHNIAISTSVADAESVASQDPTLYFEGESGELYSVLRQRAEFHSTDPANHVRAAFFAHPFFYRDGQRFDRTTILVGSQRFYRFNRH